MCIRDRMSAFDGCPLACGKAVPADSQLNLKNAPVIRSQTCLLYTSDAADERSSVDLGGRRIIKKKKKRANGMTCKDNKREVEKL